MYQNEPFVYIVDGDLTYLKQKLKKGTTVLARVVVRLTENKYILRILGHNLVMKTHLKFNQFDEVELMINEVSPKFDMSLKARNHSSKSESKSNSKNTDLYV